MKLFNIVRIIRNYTVNTSYMQIPAISYSRGGGGGGGGELVCTHTTQFSSEKKTAVKCGHTHSSYRCTCVDYF